jgi:hypothetical protein
MTFMTGIKFVVFLVFIFAAGVPIYALPATLTLAPGQRPSVEKLTINEAAQQLTARGESGWDLVEAARSLVGERMAYSRRNSFDSPSRAFERGYGYCMQHAYALISLLEELGFEAKVVQAFSNLFPNGVVTSHAWVSVKIGDEIRYIDPLFYDELKGKLDFIPLSEVTTIPTAFKLFTFWGGPAVNAHRFYLTGKDY